MLHDTRDKEVFTVAYSVYLDFGSHHVLVDEYGILDIVAHDDAHILDDISL